MPTPERVGSAARSQARPELPRCSAQTPFPIGFCEASESVASEGDELRVAAIVGLTEIRAPHQPIGAEKVDELADQWTGAAVLLGRVVEVVGGDLQVEIREHRELE